ncbi:MAG TPA: helix-turn-helix domain-containing protein [Candidatus Faecimonas gallistercoris]|nr:helix-turn-helix domain-containing protein [Candidatus Faecimonas gallistercoris]
MKELGEYLKHTRISNGVSMEEAAEDLELSTSQLENIESGNVRAFKDVYGLKQYIHQYAKYLGLDPEKVVDEFNGFLFEHTSKISLDDIKEAQRKLDEKEQKKIKSPYTIIHKKKMSIWPFVFIPVVVILLFIIIYLIVSSINRPPVVDTELVPKVRKESIYEFTY